MKSIFALLPLLFIAVVAHGEKSKGHKKTQEVNFEGADIDGQVRNPDGAYLLQKKGVKFMPLYKVQKHFDEEIKSSVDYLR